jgi:serine/threonine-protein kinase
VIGNRVDGKYLIQSLLGQGGMGSVYQAEHTSTGRRCAVKVINAGELTKDPQVLSRFEREARAAGAIDTQHITQVLDAGVDRESGLPFMAMEFLEGEDLQRMLKRVGPVSPDLTLRVVAQACLGLEKAHKAKVVHRDIKPHNLFLARRDAGEVVVKLLDFGIAKVKMDQAQTKEGADLTRTGNLLGSPLYVSPEQARGKRQIDHRTDIYSLGAVAYQMVCGRTPYEHATALGELILMVCTEPPAPVQDHAPWVPPAVAELIHKCLRKNPDERFQTAGELFDAVKRLLPHGWKISEEMLVSLADSQRNEEAPRMPMSEPPPSALDSGTYDAVGAATHSTIGGQSTIGGGDPSVTTGPMVHTSRDPAGREPSGASKLPMIGVAALVMVIAAGGVWALTRPATGAAGAATQPQPQPEPVESSAPAPVPAPPPAPPEKRRVSVSVRPKDASVEVEGKAVKLRDGELDLEGEVGASFRVRVFQGISEQEGEVVISLSGPRPNIIELEIGKKVKFSPTPAPSPGTAPAPGQQPKPSTGSGTVPFDDDESDFKPKGK